MTFSLQVSLHNQRAFFNLLQEYNLELVITEPTRVTKTTRTVLDVIRVSCSIELLVNFVKVIQNDDFGDHAFVLAQFSIKLLKQSRSRDLSPTGPLVVLIVYTDSVSAVS